MKKKTVHILLAISLSFLAVGALFSIIGLSLGGTPDVSINLSGIHVGALEPIETDTPTITSFDKLVMDLSFTDVEIISSTDFKLEITGRGTTKPIMKLENGVLSINNSTKKAGFYFFNFGINNQGSKVKLFVPENFIIKEGSIKNNFGDVSFENIEAENISYEGHFGNLTYRGSITKSLTSNNDFGDVSFTGSFQGKMNLYSHFGNIDFRTDLEESNYNYELKSSFGDANWNQETFQNKSQNNHADNHLKMESNFGDITASTR